MSHVWNEPTDSIAPLLDAIIDEIPAPEVVEGTPQMLITSLEYSPYVGRIAVGKITRGELRAGQNVTLAKRDGETMIKTRIKELMVFDGLGKKKVEEAPVEGAEAPAKPKRTRAKKTEERIFNLVAAGLLIAALIATIAVL